MDSGAKYQNGLRARANVKRDHGACLLTQSPVFLRGPIIQK